MRLWMRARMRRRGKRGANDSESTGKIGQEIPANQPTPLQPMYPEDKRNRAPGPSEVSPAVNSAAVTSPDATEPAEATPAAISSAPVAVHSPAAATPDQGKLVVETQPESPSVPPPEAPSASQKDLKGYVVLAI